MAKHVLFATSAVDALDACHQHGLNFEDGVFVMNYQLLGSYDYSDYTIYYTELFTKMPAYQEAVAHMGEGEIL